jgi:Cof subfamily protein (haloacid dehalogenase superfamily)
MPVVRHDVPPGMTPGGRFAAWRRERPRFIACDLDGTLLAGSPIPSARVLASLAAADRSEVRVGVATGRMEGAARATLAAAPFSGPHVFHNGALVRDQDERTIAAWYLSDAQVDALLEFARERDDLALEVYPEDGYLIDRQDSRAAVHAALLEIQPSRIISTSLDLDRRQALKAVVLAFSEEAAKASRGVALELGLSVGAASSPATPEVRYLNLTHADTDKGRAVLAAAASTGTDAMGTAAIGDETNDLTMLGVVGTAIAMASAPEEVRAVAHLIAPSCSQDGAALALDLLMTL